MPLDVSAIFLDDGGVINDNDRRAPEYRRLLGEFFPPRLGGTPEAWAEANRTTAPPLWQEPRYGERAGRFPDDYAGFDRDYQIEWLTSMCRVVGVPVPADEDQAHALADEASVYVTSRVQSAYPGAVAAIHRVHAAGYTLYTASGSRSRDLDGYLTALGVRHLFRRLYGPDLVNTYKRDPEYYRRIFADAGVPPAQAVVLDDSPRMIRRAIELGARGILVGQAPEGDDGDLTRIAGLAELPDVLGERV